MKLMHFVTILLGVSFASSAQDHGQSNQQGVHRPQISYIGFNTLKTDHKPDRVTAFKDYVDTITPIMERYGHTLDVYRVDHNSDPEHPVDFITFGTAPTQEAFQAFFADAEFQQAFPTLVGIIGRHYVTFVGSPVVPERVHGGYTQLTLDWLKPMDDGLRSVFGGMEERLLSLGHDKGARRTHRAGGTLASTGLTDDLAPAEAPTVVSLWHMTDPHAFLENDSVSALNKRMAGHSKQFRSYWISPMR